MNEVVEKKATEVAKANGGSLKEILKSDSFSESIAGFFESEKNRQRFVQSAVNAITRTPALAKCSKMSFFGSLIQLAQFGLNVDGRNAHLIPYKDTCTLIIDYKGMITLAYRCPDVAKVEAFAVCKNDTFRLVDGEVHWEVDNPFVDRGEVVGYYAMCQFKNGVKKFEIMSKAEVDAVRKRSRAANNGPWVTDYNEMAKKTVFKRLSKWLPVTPELQDAIAQDNEEYEHEQESLSVKRKSRVMASDLLNGGDSSASHASDERESETVDAEFTESESESTENLNA